MSAVLHYAYASHPPKPRVCPDCQKKFDPDSRTQKRCASCQKPHELRVARRWRDKHKVLSKKKVLL